MHPILWANSYLQVPTFGVCLVLGFTAVTLWAGYRTKASGLDPNVCPALALWVIPAALLGAKVFSIGRFVLQGGAAYHMDLQSWAIVLSGGGMIAYGGIIAGFLAAGAFMRVRRLEFLPYADAYAPALGLGIFCMRLGCFFAGCCWGQEGHGFLSVEFPPYSNAGAFQRELGFTGLFPSQLLGAVDGLLIAACLLMLEKSKPRPGMLFLVFIFLYSTARFGEDFTRFYSHADRALTLTYNQWISLSAAIGASLLILRRNAAPYQLTART